MTPLVDEISETVRRLPRRKQRTVLDFARSLEVEGADEQDSNDPDDPDSKVFDVTAAMGRSLRDIKAGRGRPLREALDEL